MSDNITMPRQTVQQILAALRVAVTPLPKDRQAILRLDAALRTALEQQAEPQTCLWLPWDDDAMPSTYHSACGEVFSFTEGGLQENGFRFCYACGGKVVEAAHHIQEPKS